jgi:hypothetical protein
MALIKINKSGKVDLSDSDNTKVRELLDEDLLIYEDIQGSKIYAQWDGENFTIIPKSLNNKPINIIDLATQKYYNLAINFFYNLDERIKKMMPKKWFFVFEYFPDDQPGNIKYDRVPKNNLILTGIKKNKNFDFNYDELVEYSNLLGTEHLPVLFKGKLDQKQQEAIGYFLNTSPDDLEYVFGEKNFAFFFYKLLNPNLKTSFLMDSDFQDNMEKIVIRSKSTEDCFVLLNPMYQRLSYSNSTEFTDVYSLVLLNFLTFCQTLDLTKVSIKGDRKDTIYINLISVIFNMYMKESYSDLVDFEITIPDFFNKDKFKINKELITNKATRAYIDNNDKIEYFFKIILGSFRYTRKKKIGIMGDATLELFNTLVIQLDAIIDYKLNKISDDNMRKTGLVDFNKYMDFKIDLDGEGKVYPDVYKEFQDIKKDDKKKMFVKKK